MNKKTILISLVVLAVIAVQVCIFMVRPKVVVATDDAAQLHSALIAEPTSTVAQAAITPSASVPAEPKLAKARVDVSSMHLELIGTALGNTKDPIAIIKDLDSNRQTMYKTGHQIKDGTVVRIAKGEVELDVDGARMVLRTVDRRAVLARAVYNESIVARENNTFDVNKQNLISDVSSIMGTLSRIKVKPCYDAKKVIGLKVEGVGQDSIVALAGIRDKDVVTSVNMQKIDSYQKALQVFNKVKNQKEIKVCLLRDGEFKEFSYSMR
ncbi:MAG TPA: type II secretion system protein N [Candidatus Omnitrophota bacterium]|nr:type II secretion system protein N [Candidatus Omnitrophota bacterium]HRZ15651.1 type II secretion system protein N [Candidatus Omnitrophota bacterium]